ncbi:MAG: hemolysin III family protein [Clostridia bacterium]|nr:hemolysin III family protein [Clostridia bacterium]
MKSRKPVYTLAEELINSISHGTGALAAAGGMAVLIVFSALQGDVWKVVSSSIYGATMILLYTFSALYHSFRDGKVKSVFRVFDHCSIFLLIAGSYTPFTLVTLREATPAIGWTLFCVVWGAAIIGVVLNIVSLEKFKVFSMICYIAMGWAVVFAIKPLIANLAKGGIILLAAGGLAYTVGIIFYAIRKKYMHSIWHFFVLGGTILQYFAVLFYVVL